jgi:hypothetical protein
MRRFVLGWKKLGHEQRLGAYIVNYTDDLVICCRGRAEEALATTRVSKLPEYCSSLGKAKVDGFGQSG